MTKKQYTGSLWQPENVKDDSMRIEQLYNTLQISYKAFNVCRNNGIYTLRELIDYFAEHGSLLELKSCGKKTQQELFSFLDKVSTAQKNPGSKHLPEETVRDLKPVLTRKAAIIEAIDNLGSSEARQLFDWYAQYLSEACNTRTYRVLNEIFEHSWMNRQAWEAILFRADTLNRVGKQTRLELRQFASDATDFARLVMNDRRKAVMELLIKFFKVNWDIAQSDQYLEVVKGKINVFKIAMPVLQHSPEMGKSRVNALNLLLTWDRKNRKLTFKNLAAELQLSELRTGQIVNELKHRIKISLEPVALFVHNASEWFPSVFLGSEPYMRLDRELFDHAGIETDDYHPVQYPALISFALSSLAVDVYPDPLMEVSDQYWLLNKETAGEVDLKEMSNMIKKLQRIKRNETERYDLSSIFDWWPVKNRSDTAPTLKLIAEVLGKYSGIKLNDDKWIEFSANSRRSLVKYIEAVLIESNNPMEVFEIYKAVSRQFPAINVRLSSVKAALTRERDIFVRTENAGVYGLKKWDDFAVRLKTNEVVTAVVNMLEASPLPRHVYDLVRYINLTSTIELDSMITILKNDPEDRFRFFPGQFIGLHQKTYPKDRVKFEIVTPDTEAMITHYIKDNGPVNKIEIVHLLSRKYGLEPVQVEFAIARAEESGKVNDKNGFLM